ncbi:LysR substrate-binding domain-containing protein [Gordonia sinesedis]
MGNTNVAPFYTLQVVDVSLRRLRAFVTVAEELHFTRAAARLFVAQQSLSRQIAQLESDVGAALLRRTSRSVELTPAGEVFLAAARDTLERFDRGVAETRAVADQARDVLRVGFVTGAALELTAPIVAAFTAAHPGTRIELRESGFDDPSAGATGGEVDVVIIRLPNATEGLVTYPLFAEPCVLVVSRAHRLGHRRSVRIADLLGETLAVGRTADRVWRDFWLLADGRGDRAESPGSTVVETTSQTEEIEVVSAGLACAVAPAALSRYSPHPGIRFVPIEDGPRSVVALAHGVGEVVPQVRSFVNIALDVRDRESEIVRGIEHPDTPGSE